MKIIGLIWPEHIVAKIDQRHHVQQSEIREVFISGPKFRFVERGYRRGENVYAAMGQTNSGRYLIIFFVHRKDNKAIILTARDMTQAERRKYEKK